MEDYFDTILYIVIALITLAASFLGKKKKQSASPGQVSHPFDESELNVETPFFRSLEDIINEQMGIAEPRTTTVKTDTEKIAKPVIQEGRSPLVEDNSPLTRSMAQPKREKIKNNEFSSPILDNDLTKPEEEESITDEFDIRQAIISSEILNRKQY